MSENQENWQEDARKRMECAVAMAIHCGAIAQLWRIVLEQGDYDAYLEAIMFCNAEESEP